MVLITSPFNVYDIKVMKITENKKYRFFVDEIFVKKDILYETEPKKAPKNYRLYYLQKLWIPMLRFIPSEFVDHSFQQVKIFADFNLKKEKHKGNFIITIKPVKQTPYTYASDYRLNIFIHKVEKFKRKVKIRKLYITDEKPDHPCIYENNFMKHYIFFSKM